MTLGEKSENTADADQDDVSSSREDAELLEALK